MTTAYYRHIAAHHTPIPPELATAANAQSEARLSLRLDKETCRQYPTTTLNWEHAYSPSTGAVGARAAEDAAHGWPFRVMNTCYPMYGRYEEVTDWVTVGWSKGEPAQPDVAGSATNG